VPDAPALAAEDLRRLLGRACAIGRGLVVLFGDAVAGPPSDLQRLIAEEQRAVGADCAVGLLLAPREPATGLAPDSASPAWLTVTLDEAERGIATAGSLALAVQALANGPAALLPRLLVVHSVQGHRPGAIAAMAAALRPHRAILWLHDFAFACANPRLLRNDAEFCHAPSAASLACRVCLHGPARPPHLAGFRTLLAAVPFQLLASSDSVPDTLRAAGFVMPDVAVHESGLTATYSPDDATPPTTDRPDLHLVLDGTRLEGTETDGVWRFRLPAAAEATARAVRLRSRLMVTAEGDRRRLGVAVSGLRLDGLPVAPEDPRRRSGWYPPQPGWQWTDGAAVLEVGAARMLEVTVQRDGRYRQVPLLAAAPAG
jgi:hypothetical protein